MGEDSVQSKGFRAAFVEWEGKGGIWHKRDEIAS
jgi:hypothetical protein